MEGQFFVEIGAVIVVAGLFSALAYRLRQPLIVGYILTGILVGPSVFGVIHSPEIFSGLSQFGVALLLFMVGLNLNWRSIKDVGKAALLVGTAQVVFTSLIGIGIGRILGFDYTTSAFLSVAFAFSSTIVIVKLLTDKEDLERLYGRIAVGMLIVQDLIAMFLLLVIAALRDGGDIATIVTESLVKGLGVLLVLGLFSYVGLPKMFRAAARSQELLFLAALAWCFGIATALFLLGFGIEIGALLAGITLAGSGFHNEIEAKIRPLRDFFLIIFFIALGSHLTLDAIGGLAVPAIVFSLFILFGNPFIVMVIMRFMGYHPRTGFLVGTTVAQISEFSFIVLTSGIAIGMIEPSTMALATVVGLATITGSSYLVIYAEPIYEKVGFLFERFAPGRLPTERVRTDAPASILLGYQRMGRRVLPAMDALPGELLVVDFNPSVLEELAQKGVPAFYGDAANSDVLRFIRAEKAKLIVSTIPDMNVSYSILDYLATSQFRGSVIVTVRRAEEAARCYALGATYVVIPSVLGGEALGQYLKTKKTAKAGWKALANKQSHQE